MSKDESTKPYANYTPEKWAEEIRTAWEKEVKEVIESFPKVDKDGKHET